jgi:outer membrane protein OmpA-like peptidoglycan-associated protein
MIDGMIRLAAAAALVLALAAPPAPAFADPAPGPAPRRRTVITESSCEILGPIRFAGATAELVPDAGKMLDLLARTLESNPDLRVIEIRAFGAGPARGRQALAEARARAIADQLVRRGVDASRLRANGIARPPRGGSGDPEILILHRGS